LAHPNFPKISWRRVSPDPNFKCHLKDSVNLCAKSLENIKPEWAEDVVDLYNKGMIRATIAKNSYCASRKKIFVLPRKSICPDESQTDTIRSDARVIAHEFAHTKIDHILCRLDALKEFLPILLGGLVLCEQNDGNDTIARDRQIQTLACYCERFANFRDGMENYPKYAASYLKNYQPQYFVGAIASAIHLPTIQKEPEKLKDVVSILNDHSLSELTKFDELGITTDSTLAAVMPLFDQNTMKERTFHDIPNIKRR
jgi:hypothetical protein